MTCPSSIPDFKAMCCTKILLALGQNVSTSVAVCSNHPTNQPHIDDHRARYSLLKACFHANLFSFLSAIPPRLCRSVFYLAQPLLINTTVSYVGDASADISFGRALIGAWALVFLGIAVLPDWLLIRRPRNADLHAVLDRIILLSGDAIRY